MPCELIYKIQHLRRGGHLLSGCRILFGQIQGKTLAYLGPW